MSEDVRVATALGFGPRFLHSTGRAYKDGANSGVFLQLTCEHERGLAIPGRKETQALAQRLEFTG